MKRHWYEVRFLGAVNIKGKTGKEAVRLASIFLRDELKLDVVHGLEATKGRPVEEDEG